jgi:hypothetical protein
MTVTNRDRAEWAAHALRQFQDATGTDYEDALPDLLCDLMHWSDRENNNFQASLDRAHQHYEAEIIEAASEPKKRPADLAKLAHQLCGILRFAVDTEEGNWKTLDDEPGWMREARALIMRVPGGAA